MTFYVPDDFNAPVRADGIAGAFAEILHNGWAFDEWELYPMVGPRISRGSLSRPGNWVGDAMAHTYCAYFRMPSATDPSRPSTKFMHGVAENMMDVDAPSAPYAGAVSAVGVYLVAEGILDSDGAPIVDFDFAHWSRRAKVARRV